MSSTVEGHNLYPEVEIQEAERGDYNPTHAYSTPRLNSGYVSMRQQVDRSSIPPGRFADTAAANATVQRPRETHGESVDPQKAAKAYNSLGHVKNQRSNCDFKRAKSRDLVFYMSNDRVRNILYENHKTDSTNLKTISARQQRRR